ncbi:MAG TPA: hypothetical protein DEO88_04900 [Syntrophobacteraceae bacterium]|nr:hypothetical protein [Syntrophobacteraceae bacterium]
MRMAMPADSRILEILRQVGAAEPASIKLTKILQSPEQDFFAFSLAAGKSKELSRILDQLARSSVNVRFFNSHLGSKDQVRIQLCIDADSHMDAIRFFQAEENAGNLESLHHRLGVRILSLYPFSGEAKIAERLLSMLRFQNIKILGLNCATSVISCVIPTCDCELATASLRRTFIFP